MVLVGFAQPTPHLSTFLGLVLYPKPSSPSSHPKPSSPSSHPNPSSPSSHPKPSSPSSHPNPSSPSSHPKPSSPSSHPNPSSPSSHPKPSSPSSHPNPSSPSSHPKPSSPSSHPNPSSPSSHPKPSSPSSHPKPSSPSSHPNPSSPSSHPKPSSPSSHPNPSSPSSHPKPSSPSSHPNPSSPSSHPKPSSPSSHPNPSSPSSHPKPSSPSSHPNPSSPSSHPKPSSPSSHPNPSSPSSHPKPSSPSSHPNPSSPSSHPKPSSPSSHPNPSFPSYFPKPSSPSSPLKFFSPSSPPIPPPPPPSRPVSRAGGANGGGYLLNNYEPFAITVGAILLCGILNSFSIKFIGRLAVISAVYQMGLAIVIMIMLPAVAPAHQTPSFIFTHYHVQLDVSLLPSVLSQYSLYAYDTVAHMVEETKRSDRTSPASMVLCLSAVSLLAWGLLLAFTFCIQGDENLTSPGSVTGGQQILVTIIWEVFVARFGNGTGAVVVLSLIYVPFGNGTGAVVVLSLIYVPFLFHPPMHPPSCYRVFLSPLVPVSCNRFGNGTGAVVVLSLIYVAFLFGAYAISRDKGLPFAFIWRRVNRDKTPIYSVWLCCGVAILFSLPLLKDSFLFSAITSLATVAWVGGYAVPIFFRLIQREEDFEPGPFYLSKYVGVWGR
ncbi:unnamed protein product [Closterium sp. Naga37s-1]|nr:unnamed protein product [Closterium sp. Naga37s-1]